MKPENLSHRALMMLINAKLDYLISENYAHQFETKHPENKTVWTNAEKYREDAKKKLESEIKSIVAKDKTKGGWDA